MLTLGVLERVERLLRERLPPAERESFVLADYFDLIAGTSTGSIIAAWLALGNTVDSARALYLSLGPKVFSKPRLAGQLLWAKFDEETFESILREKFGEVELSSPRLRTGLLVTCKRVDTGSAWILGNNPKAKFWKYDQFRLLRQLIQASTAAPTFFTPVEIGIGNGETGLFLDGAMGGHNNPAVAAFFYATAAEYNLNWATGADQLFMLNIGTGFQRPAFPAKKFRNSNVAIQAVRTLQGLIHETAMTAVFTMQALSNPTNPFRLNSEVLGLENTLVGGVPLLSYERLDPPIDREGLMKEYQLDYSPTICSKLGRMDIGELATIERLLLVGRKCGAAINPNILP